MRGYLKAVTEQIDAEDVANSKYLPQYCDLVKTMGGSGFSLRAFAAQVDVTYRTVLHWIGCIPEFYEAAKIAEMKRHFFYEQRAIENLENKDFNSSLFNKLTQAIIKWNEQPETHQHIHIEGQAKSPEQMTARERIDRIKELQDSLQLASND